MTQRESTHKMGGRERQAGFTLISTVISFTVASAALFGGWVALRDIQMQWRVSNAERQMDQYAHAAMSEMVNVLSWSYGGLEIRSGRNMAYDFAMIDLVTEHDLTGFQAYPYHTNQYYLPNGHNGGFVQMQFDRDRGILFDRQAPLWSVDARGRTAQYIWQGRNPRISESAAFDRRDRMSVVGFEITRPLRNEEIPGAGSADEVEAYSRDAFYRITLVMQYRYEAAYGVALFTDEYLRERVYRTKIFSGNWDVEQNPFRAELLEGVYLQ